jgi:nucleoside-diphosphate-sugar epimerase
LCKTLINRGFSLRIYDKFYFGRKSIENLPIRNNDFIEGDIRDLPDDLFDNVYAVIHLAGLSNDPTANFNPNMNREINTEATIKLAKEAKKAGVERFIFASTCSIYDLGIGVDDSMKDEESKVNPKHHYSSSKYRAEKQLLKLNSKNFAVTILRKGTIHGYSPRMRYDLVVNVMVRNVFMEHPITVFCKGVQWRPIVDVEDVAEAYQLILEARRDIVGGEIFNICEDNYQVEDIARKICHVITTKYISFSSGISFEKDDKKDRSYRVSNDKIKNMLGFSFRHSLNASVKRLVKEIKENDATDFDSPIYYNIKHMTPIFEKEDA